MEITEIRIKLMEEAGERLQAFCSITFDDCFVVRDLKIIGGANGPFVAMPSRKLTAHCPQCSMKNHLRAAYCNQCGMRLNEERFCKDDDGRAKLYADIAHPINSTCREMIQDRIIQAYHDEVERSKLPGYVSSYQDFDHEDYSAPISSAAKPARREPSRQHRIDAAHTVPSGTSGSPRRPYTAPRPNQAASVQQVPAARSNADTFGAGIF